MTISQYRSHRANREALTLRGRSGIEQAEGDLRCRLLRAPESAICPFLPLNQTTEAWFSRPLSSENSCLMRELLSTMSSTRLSEPVRHQQLRDRHERGDAQGS